MTVDVYQRASRVRKKRAERVQKGLCGLCGRKRENFAFLCDPCAADHRERQRRKAAAARGPLSEKEEDAREDREDANGIALNPKHPPPTATERVRLKLVYSVVPSGAEWSVQRTLNGSTPKLVSTHATE